MSGPVRFRELNVIRMPGFEDRGFRLTGLAPGINLVHGPNASGKTTAGKALQRLLWPGEGEDRAVISGLFTLDDVDWRVEVDGSRVLWERDGQPSSRPALPDGNTKDRYNLSLTRLLETDDQGLAERIRVESAGGYNVPAAADDLGFGAGGHPRKLMTELASARADLDGARQAAEELRRDRDRLEGLEAHRQALAEAGSRVPVLERARAVATKRSDREVAEAAMSQYPEAAGTLSGDEVERWEEWAEKEAELRGTIATASANEAEAELEKDQADLGEDGLAASQLKELELRHQAIRDAEGEIEVAERELGEARGRRERAGEALGIDPEDRPGDLRAPDTAALDSLLERAQHVKAERAAYEEWLRLLGGDHGAQSENGSSDAEADSESLRASIQALRTWLTSAAGGGQRQEWAGLVKWSIIAFFLLAALLAVGTLAGPPVLIAAAIAGAGLGAIAGVLLLVLRPATHTNYRKTLEAEVVRHGHAPEEWTDDAVRNRLEELEQRAARLTLEAQRKAEVARWEKKREQIEEAEVELQELRSELEASLGLDLDGGDLTLTLAARRLGEWEDARATEQAAQLRLQKAKEEYDKALGTTRRLVEPFGFEPEDAAAVAGQLAELRDRREQHKDAVVALAGATRVREEAEGALEELAGKRQELLGRVGADGEQALRNLAEQRADRVRTERDLELAEREMETARSALREAVERLVDHTSATDADAIFADLASAPLAELEGRLDEAQEANVEEREVAKEIAGIESNIETARTRHDVENALAAVDAAKSALADQRDQDIDDEIGTALVAWLEASESDSNRPKVFHRAKELFATITRGHYRLDLSRKDDGFRAYDNVADRGRALVELSAGTRIQLLLAVRVAFVETQEQGAAPPLLLDEVLANADDVRARAIIEAAMELARSGRQVFYFTAQADELTKWRELLEGAEDLEWTECGIQDAAPDSTPLDWSGRSVERPAVPAPDGHDHESYRAVLRVPPFDPWTESIGGLHLWYVLEDVEQLHQLLELEVDCWGKLEGLGRSGAGQTELVRHALEDGRKNADLCRRFGELWRRGRGRPVDRTALEESGAVSEVFMDRVTDLCESLEGDGEALLEALEEKQVSHFRSDAVQELSEFFLRHGYVTREEPLEPDEIRLDLVGGIGGDGDPVEVDEHVRDLMRRLQSSAGEERDLIRGETE